jgi:outer membrane protein TolC
MNRQISQLTLKPTNLLSLKNTIVYLLIFLMATPAMAQHYSTNPKQSESGTTRRDTVKVTDVREKLVQLALQNPSFEVADREVNKAVYEMKKAKSAWLGAVSGQINVNEVSINEPIVHTATNTNFFYPRWNIGLNVPLDFFSNKKNDKKIAGENLLIAEAQKNELYRKIRADVLSAYEDYLMFKEQLDLQARVTQDQSTILLAKEQDYKDGLINSEEYNKYFAAASEQKSKLAEARRNLNTSKITIEAMIGIPLEQAIGSK